MASSVSPSPTTAASGYFVDQKKGEVNELKQLLKNLNVERDVKRKREIIKKVIAYMTLGIDVSRLFTDMIMAIETKDIVIKKMVYLYLCNYAHKQPDMAIMCINSLRRDCDNEDPIVRGLALRSLCNLRLQSILEYVEQPLQKSLTDISHYVRKTAVIGILKLNDLSPSFVETHDYLPQLYRMLNDVDANVVTNVIMVLNELLLSEGGMVLTQSTVMLLLNRIGEFSEWGLNSILDLVSRYSPASEEEIFAIMNLLDPVLRTANSGAVLATFKCFMHLTSTFPELQPQIYARAKPPLLTLITGSNFEVQFAALKHIEVILSRKAAAGIFDSEFRQFFVRYNEPSYVKHLKITIIPLIANDTNAKEISAELQEYVTDVDSELSRLSVNALGNIAMRVSTISAEITQTLLELVDFDISYVRAQAVKNLSSILRIFPSVRGLILPVISKCLRKVEDPDAKACLVWMLGRFGNEIVEAPYLLESIIDNYEDEQSAVIKLQVLYAAMKLFFVRPPEMQAMLGRLLVCAVNDTLNQDVHDRALLYYRLLSSNELEVTQSLFDSPFVEGSTMPPFSDDIDDELRNKIFDEFNTLAVIYGAPSSQFIAEDYQLKLANAPISENYFDSVPKIPPSAMISHDTIAPPVISSVGSVNLIDFGDSDSLTSQPGPPTLSLRPAPILNPQQFQQHWVSYPETFNSSVSVRSEQLKSLGALEALLRSQHICTLASGSLPAGELGFKLFLFCCEFDPSAGSDGILYLIQLIVNSGLGTVGLTIKSMGRNSALLADTLISNCKS